ncbi:MAG: Rpn family recombination-promoting nuclease/putative transposase [Nannocystaceae bacterium]
MHLLDPCNDLVFKLLLTRRPELLPDMLTGILERPILYATVINPTIPTGLPTDKEIALDIRAELDDGSRADVEMQRRIPPALRPRLVYYGARDYADQLDRGDGYHFLEPTAVVAWLVEPLFPKLGFHPLFELRDRYTNARLSDHLAVHLLQLNALSRATTTGYAAIVQRWARFFLADPIELAKLASEDPIMSIAKQTLEELSRDPVTRRLARDREDARKLYLMDLAVSEANGEAKGKIEGKTEGKAEVLLELLQLRFGSVPEATRAKVDDAKLPQLDVWVARVLTAKTLEEVFAQ